MPAIDIIKNLIKNTGIGLGSGEQCYDIMYAVTRAFQVKSIVEIGTYKAYSTIVMCQAILDNKFIPIIYTFDQWNNNGLDISKVENVARNNLILTGFNKYITIIKGDSKITVPKLFKQIDKIDMCFIDGDHSWEGVSSDFNNCKNYTDIILFHDTQCGKDVVKFLPTIEQEGWKAITFPTKYIEQDNHEIGISLAIRI